MTAPRRKYFVFSYYWRERGNFSKIKNRKESRAVGNLRASGDDHQLFFNVALVIESIYCSFKSCDKDLRYAQRQNLMVKCPVDWTFQHQTSEKSCNTSLSAKTRWFRGSKHTSRGQETT